MPAVAYPVRDDCLAPDRAIDAPIAPGGGRYGRAFPDLLALTGDQAALLALGAAGGLCDGSDATGDDGTAAAGWPFFGQFIAHDPTTGLRPAVPDAFISQLHCGLISAHNRLVDRLRDDGVDAAECALPPAITGDVDVDHSLAARDLQRGAAVGLPSGEVADVLLGLLDADPESYRALDPGWQPTLPAAGERFTVLDLLVGAS